MSKLETTRSGSAGSSNGGNSFKQSKIEKFVVPLQRVPVPGMVGVSYLDR